MDFAFLPYSRTGLVIRKITCTCEGGQPVGNDDCPSPSHLMSKTDTVEKCERCTTFYLEKTEKHECDVSAPKVFGIVFGGIMILSAIVFMGYQGVQASKKLGEMKESAEESGEQIS